MNDKAKHLTILLATYNGQAFIRQQLNSILTQSLDITKTIIVSDDCSFDGTLQVIAEVSERCVNDKIIVATNSTQLGHVKNFARLCEMALLESQGYICFCDQDDIWYPDKIEVMWSRMNRLELTQSTQWPIMVHSDLTVVDNQLNQIAPSFFQFQGLKDPLTHDFPAFLYQNIVTGCACMFNRSLLAVATPMPSSVVAHDWWFALCAKTFGILDFIDKPLVYYRQHSDNAIGATAIEKQRSFLYRHFYQSIMRFPNHLSQAISQAKSLYALIEANRSEALCRHETLAEIQFFAGITQQSTSVRLSAINRLFGVDRAWSEKIYLSIVMCFMKEI